MAALAVVYVGLRAIVLASFSGSTSSLGETIVAVVAGAGVVGLWLSGIRRRLQVLVLVRRTGVPVAGPGVATRSKRPDETDAASAVAMVDAAIRAARPPGWRASPLEGLIDAYTWGESANRPRRSTPGERSCRPPPRSSNGPGDARDL